MYSHILLTISSVSSDINISATICVSLWIHKASDDFRKMTELILNKEKHLLFGSVGNLRKEDNFCYWWGFSSFNWNVKGCISRL